MDLNNKINKCPPNARNSIYQKITSIIEIEYENIPDLETSDEYETYRYSFFYLYERRYPKCYECEDKVINNGFELTCKNCGLVHNDTNINFESKPFDFSASEVSQNMKPKLNRILNFYVIISQELDTRRIIQYDAALYYEKIQRNETIKNKIALIAYCHLHALRIHKSEITIQQLCAKYIEFGFKMTLKGILQKGIEYRKYFPIVPPDLVMDYLHMKINRLLDAKLITDIEAIKVKSFSEIFFGKLEERGIGKNPITLSVAILLISLKKIKKTKVKRVEKKSVFNH